MRPKIRSTLNILIVTLVFCLEKTTTTKQNKSFEQPECRQRLEISGRHVLIYRMCFIANILRGRLNESAHESMVLIA